MKYLFLVSSLIFVNSLFAQYKQAIYGKVTDETSGLGLPGVVVIVTTVSDRLISTTDTLGNFIINEVPVGRINALFTMAGYEPYAVRSVLLISGKQLELNAGLKENLKQLNEVTVSTKRDRTGASNEFATVSARSFSVEETKRYAATFSDPARMVVNFPGVSSNGDDNSIVVRGNSPQGVLWRLEGIEIPNPNHYAELGNSGGAISMLNASMLGNSDFYTGAFPAEIGNALSGVFDLKFRNGNSERREHSFQLGALGTELASEGPFKQGSKASYLFNFRYSTLSLLGGFLDLNGLDLDYQDAALKINLPTNKFGTFSLFALGGRNSSFRLAEADSAIWDNENNFNFSYKGINWMSVAGVSHTMPLKHQDYIKTILSMSYTSSVSNGDTLDPGSSYKSVPVEQTAFYNKAYRFSVLYNKKVNAANSYRLGVIAQQLNYDLDFSVFNDKENVWKSFLEGKGSTGFFQAYAQWKTRFTESFTVTGGLHGSLLQLNGQYSIEPRIAAAYTSGTQRFTLAAGLHSKPEHLSTYYYQYANQGDPLYYPNKNLELQKAFHAVAGYTTPLSWGMMLKTEIYYQYLYRIPVEADSNSGFSTINADHFFSLLRTEKALVSKGQGKNYGLDISVEKPLSNGFYGMVSGSLFRSLYRAYDGTYYNSRYDKLYQANMVMGKEIIVDKKGKKSLGINGGIIMSGGMRESEIDLKQSQLQQKEIIVPGSYFSRQAPAYFKPNLGLSYKINRSRSTHSILLEVQNIANRKNYFPAYYDAGSGTIKRYEQMGLFPNLSYRIDFH